eukprot:4043120-Pleurochrysis_carterae.AAC.1
MHAEVTTVAGTVASLRVDARQGQLSWGESGAEQLRPRAALTVAQTAQWAAVGDESGGSGGGDSGSGRNGGAAARAVAVAGGGSCEGGCGTCSTVIAEIVTGRGGGRADCADRRCDNCSHGAGVARRRFASSALCLRVGAADAVGLFDEDGCGALGDAAPLPRHRDAVLRRRRRAGYIAALLQSSRASALGNDSPSLGARACCGERLPFFTRSDFIWDFSCRASMKVARFRA